MANPANPLDKYSIYTYHLAVFMHSTNTGLQEAFDSFDWQKTKTTRSEPSADVEGCLLNSVMDPHQLIQELKIQQIAPSVSSEFRASPLGLFSMRIAEPGNCMFLTKVAKLMKKYDTKAFASAVWGIKIKFVGRLPNSEIDEILELPPIVGMLIDIKGSFTQMGSTYDLSFIMTGTAGVGQLPEHSNSIYLGTIVESASISGVKTLKDTIQKLQEKLQNNYDEEMRRTHPNTEMRKIRYEFSIDDPDIAGFEVDGMLQDHPSDQKYYFTFEKNTPIAHALTTIIYRCPKLMALIGDSKEAWRKPFHMNGTMYQILSNVEYLDSEIVVRFKITLYYGSESEVPEGGTVTTNTTTHTNYVFDFYFAPDYNIDVLSFDLTANVGLILYLAGSPRLTSDAILNSNNTGYDGAIGDDTQAGYLVNKNVKTENDVPYKQHEVPTDGGTQDIITHASNNTSVGGGSSKYNEDRTAALESLSKYCSIDSVSKTLHIRGHAELLNRCLTTGDTFGTTQGIWIKLNIWSRDEETGQTDKYFYDGVYSVVSIDHVFTDGKFTQELTLMMMNFEWLKDVK